MIQKIIMALLLLVLTACGSSSVEVQTNSVANNGSSDSKDKDDSEEVCDYPISGSAAAGYSVTVKCGGQELSTHVFGTLEELQEFIKSQP